MGKSHVDDNPLVDLSPVFKDYEKHLQGLRTKYDIKSPGQKPASEETKTDKPFPAFGNEFKSSNNSGFSFGFLNNGKKEEVSKNENSDDVEVTLTKDKVEAVVEEDSLYSKKCKLFYKKDDAFTERGLGNVHLKVTEEKKVQLIVRADTSLGNILLNILITDTIPVERMGKNNLMIICVRNPPIDPKADLVPTTFLLRVKTGEDADELKDKLQELVKENSQ